MKLNKTITYLALLILFSSLIGKQVAHSEFSNDFVPVKYSKQQIDGDKIIALKEKTDLPELFKTKSAIKEEVRSDSTVQEINGYRVQVFKSEEMIDSKNMESMYIEMFGEEEVKLIFEQPFYKIRIGNLRDREEGEDFQEILKQRGIRNTILVPDLVKVLMPVKKKVN
ncbi:MAG: SPOR domain-containing protein [Candidatus Delongbacteria bacterium]|nr:SPOR domain-containing protein [Candidatus Delongbacteria bacterium]